MLESSNLERAIQLLKGRQPIKEGIERELIKTRLELFRVQKVVAKKEKLLEHSGGRNTREVMAWQLPTDDALHEKVIMLSNRLAEREGRELELDLILQETQRLQSRIEKQTDGRKGYAVVNTRAVNEAQAKLAELTRKTMAIVSELSMYQGTCIKQQQQVNELRLELEEAKTRVERGDAPTEEILKEWEREMRRLEQAQLSKEMASLGIAPGTTAGNGHELPDGTITYAEQRPVVRFSLSIAVMRFTASYDHDFRLIARRFVFRHTFPMLREQCRNHSHSELLPLSSNQRQARISSSFFRHQRLQPQNSMPYKCLL